MFYGKQLNRIERKLGWFIRRHFVERKMDMASWAEIKGVVDELKAKYASLHQALVEVLAKLHECSSKEHVDPAELDAVKNDLAEIATGMASDICADGM